MKGDIHSLGARARGQGVARATAAGSVRQPLRQLAALRSRHDHESTAVLILWLHINSSELVRLHMWNL